METIVRNIFGTTAVTGALERTRMFSRGGHDDDLFDPYDAFVPGHVPDPGQFLDGHDVLTGVEHVAFHRLTHDLFEERGVYDVTFGYNLARLNLDRRHETAGFRYAVDADDDAVLRAEFTPTTEFCPQSEQLTKGAFRAWNGLADRHQFDHVRVRVAPMHQRSGDINAVLEGLGKATKEQGAVPDPDTELDGDDGLAAGGDGGRLSSVDDDVPF